MNTAAEKTLYRTAALIFEELSFLLPGPASQPIGDVPVAGASVAFAGPFSGVLVVRVTRDIVPVLSQNMLGEEGSLDERMQRDALGEIANVICGNVLPKILETDEPFHLETPQHFTGPLPGNLKATLSRVADIHIGLDSGIAHLALFVSE
jgi:CheY-specific phosphatase CheX